MPEHLNWEAVSPKCSSNCTFSQMSSKKTMNMHDLSMITNWAWLQFVILLMSRYTLYCTCILICVHQLSWNPNLPEVLQIFSDRWNMPLRHPLYCLDGYCFLVAIVIFAKDNSQFTLSQFKKIHSFLFFNRPFSSCLSMDISFIHANFGHLNVDKTNFHMKMFALGLWNRGQRHSP